MNSSPSPACAFPPALRLASRFKGAAAALFGLAALAISAPGQAALSGNLGLRDVSRLIESDGRFYIYGTGGGGKSTADGLAFQAEAMAPPWNLSLQPGNQRIWAPDGIYVDGRYYLYGSMWSETNPKKASVIVLLSTPSLDPAKAKWKDEGVVISGPSGVTHSVIDPSPIIDPDGNLWIVWGGGYPFPNDADSIFLTRIDRATGLPLTTDPGWKPPAQPGYPLKQGHKEGPAIYHHGDYFYLFYQTGSCCDTSNGGYVMHVSRASKITGPYTADSSDKVFYNANTKPGVVGPGHMGVYSGCGVERFTYHYISTDSGTIIGSNEFVWGADGWPTVGNVVSEPLKACGINASVNGGPGSSGGGGGPGGGGGGAAGAASGGATGNTAGSGGAPSTGGAPGVAGTTSSAGGTDANATGGTATAAGSTSSPGTSGTGTSTGDPADDTPGNSDAASIGCACDLGKSNQKSAGASWWLAAAFAAIWGRRNRAERARNR